jgi:hypothetical protein
MKYNIFHTSIQVEQAVNTFSMEALSCDNDKIKMPEVEQSHGHHHHH